MSAMRSYTHGPPLIDLYAFYLHSTVAYERAYAERRTPLSVAYTSAMPYYPHDRGRYKPTQDTEAPARQGRLK